MHECKETVSATKACLLSAAAEAALGRQTCRAEQSVAGDSYRIPNQIDGSQVQFECGESGVWSGLFLGL